jgi:hypothetical protein
MTSVKVQKMICKRCGEECEDCLDDVKFCGKCIRERVTLLRSGVLYVEKGYKGCDIRRYDSKGD